MFSQESKGALIRLGKHLKTVRLERNNTQKDFAVRIGISIVPSVYFVVQKECTK